MTTTNDRHSWRAELRREPVELVPLGHFLDLDGSPSDRCGCGHTRAAHAGWETSPRDDAGQVVELGEIARAPFGCALMCCGCEIFRGEADR